MAEYVCMPWCPISGDHDDDCTVQVPLDDPDYGETVTLLLYGRPCDSCRLEVSGDLFTVAQVQAVIAGLQQLAPMLEVGMAHAHCEGHDHDEDEEDDGEVLLCPTCRQETEDGYALLDTPEGRMYLCRACADARGLVFPWAPGENP